MGKVLDRQDTYKGSVWEPWTQNLYAYVGNNPVNYTDPTGHCVGCEPQDFEDAFAQTGPGEGITTDSSTAADLADPEKLRAIWDECAERCIEEGHAAGLQGVKDFLTDPLNVKNEVVGGGGVGAIQGMVAHQQQVKTAEAMIAQLTASGKAPTRVLLATRSASAVGSVMSGLLAGLGVSFVGQLQESYLLSAGAAFDACMVRELQQYGIDLSSDKETPVDM